jgi:superfamily II RNA helicase
MGLNFNIQRIIFTSLTKRSATKVVPVPPALVKQIAGRAGRRNRWGVMHVMRRVGCRDARQMP